MDSYSLQKGQEEKTSGKCRVTLLILALLGVFLLCAGSIVYLNFFPQALKKKVAEGVALVAGSEAEERFVKSPVPTYFSVFLFNVTNKDEVNEKGSKPKLQETGPYVFKLEKTRDIQNWDSERGTLLYSEIKSFHFLPEMTNGSLDDRINHVNVVSIGMAPMMEQYAPVFKTLGLSADEMISNIRGNLIETHTVAELLFKGYIIRDYFPEDNEHLCRLKNNCTFNFLKNNTRSVLIEILTGISGTDTISHVVRYNNETSLSNWYGKTCNSINGSVGPQFKPGLSKDEGFYAFSPEICRSMEFQFMESSEIEGISTLRYQVREDTLSYKEGANKCFCPDNTCEDREGLMYLGNCNQGGPVAVSWPHFYLGAQSQLQDVEGLHPDKRKHSTYIDIEPITGSAMVGFKRLQVNVIVKPDSRMRLLKHIKKQMYFPVFWIEESASIDSENASKFREKVLTPYRLGKWSLLSVMALGSFLLVVALITWTLKRR